MHADSLESFADRNPEQNIREMSLQMLMTTPPIFTAVPTPQPLTFDGIQHNIANALSAFRTVRTTANPGCSATVAEDESAVQHQQPSSTSPSRTSTEDTLFVTEALSSVTVSDKETVPKMPMPLCSICGAESTGIHFGVEACAACSAFFRRTVVLQKNYECSKSGECRVSKDCMGGQKCRGCRFRKCLQVGMDRSAVQQRRDAIGKFSKLVKRNCPSSYTEQSPGPSSISDDCSAVVSTKRSAITRAIISELMENYDILNKRRKLLYESRSFADIFEDSDLEPTAICDFGDCMCQIWRIEPRLCAEFVTACSRLTELPAAEKATICKNFILNFHAMEGSYLTWRHGGLARRIWVMPNRKFLDLSCADKCFEHILARAITVDRKTISGLFLPAFESAMDAVVGRMADLNITKVELVALAAILLLDPSTQGLDQNSRVLLQKLRDGLLRELLSYYKDDDCTDDPEVRLGDLLLLLSGIKVFAQRSLENLQLLRAFGAFPRDKLSDEIIGMIQ